MFAGAISCEISVLESYYQELCKGTTHLKAFYLPGAGPQLRPPDDFRSRTCTGEALKFPAAAVTSAGTLSQQFPVKVGAVTFYLYGYTTGS